VYVIVYLQQYGTMESSSNSFVRSHESDEAIPLLTDSFRKKKKQSATSKLLKTGEEMLGSCTSD